MALWTWNSTNWEKATWQRLARTEPVVIYGCAPSLDTADKEEKGCFRIVQNEGYKKVEPHILVAMDAPEKFEETYTLPCKKVFRGDFNKARDSKGRMVKTYSEVYFADIGKGSPIDVFFRRDADTRFLWQNNTLTVSVHLAIWMGFRKIIFSGIDLSRERFSEGEKAVDKKQEDSRARLRDQEFAFLSWFAESAASVGIELVNRSETSRLKEIMKTEVSKC